MPLKRMLSAAVVASSHLRSKTTINRREDCRKFLVSRFYPRQLGRYAVLEQATPGPFVVIAFLLKQRNARRIVLVARIVMEPDVIRCPSLHASNGQTTLPWTSVSR